jgi:hypothetical protein
LLFPNKVYKKGHWEDSPSPLSYRGSRRAAILHISGGCRLCTICKLGSLAIDFRKFPIIQRYRLGKKTV